MTSSSCDELDPKRGVDEGEKWTTGLEALGVRRK